MNDDPQLLSDEENALMRKEALAFFRDVVGDPMARVSAEPPLPDSNPKSAFGIKKPPLHLIPAPALLELACVMGLGAKKYGPYNWRRNSVAATVYVSAAMRHLASWLDGEDVDPVVDPENPDGPAGSGMSHLAHVMACMAIILDAMATGNLIDDRPPAGAAAKRIRELTIA